MADDAVLPIPNLTLAQHYFVLSSPSLKHLHESARKSLMEGIEADRECYVKSSIVDRIESAHRYGPLL